MKQNKSTVAITFDFTTASWSYVIRYCIGMMLLPVFVCASKLTGKVIKL